jgi:hypothetical protein
MTVGESAFECFKENSASRGVAMVSRGVAIRILKDQFGKKEARDVMNYHH